MFSSTVPVKPGQIKIFEKKAVIPDGLRLLQAFGAIYINLICSCPYKNYNRLLILLITLSAKKLIKASAISAIIFIIKSLILISPNPNSFYCSHLFLKTCSLSSCLLLSAPQNLFSFFLSAPVCSCLPLKICSLSSCRSRLSVFINIQNQFFLLPAVSTDGISARTHPVISVYHNCIPGKSPNRRARPYMQNCIWLF